jgi:hypothetical protein
MVFDVQYLPPWKDKFFIVKPRLGSQAGRHRLEPGLRLIINNLASHLFKSPLQNAPKPVLHHRKGVFERVHGFLAPGDGRSRVHVLIEPYNLRSESDLVVVPVLCLGLSAT